jgi:hypothetical protein
MAETNFDQNPNSNTMSPNENLVRNWLTGIAIVLVVLIAITYILHRNSSNPTVAGDMNSAAGTSATSTDSTSSQQAATAGSAATGFTPLAGTLTTTSNGEALAVSDQTAGSSVAVSSMTLFRKSWVAVEAMDGSILGAGLFPADSTSGTIPLLRDTVVGEQYEVVIYDDATDKDFDFHQDHLVVGAGGSAIGASFSAQ